MPLFVLPLGEATSGQFLLLDQDALLYFMPILAHNLVSAGTRCDAENNPPVRLQLCGRPFTLSLASSLCLALRFARFLFLASTLFGFL